MQAETNAEEKYQVACENEAPAFQGEAGRVWYIWRLLAARDGSLMIRE